MHFSLSTDSSSPAIMAITLMRYMWSAMLSGPFTPLRTHPVRFVTLRLWRMRRKSIALATAAEGSARDEVVRFACACARRGGGRLMREERSSQPTGRERERERWPSDDDSPLRLDPLHLARARPSVGVCGGGGGGERQRSEQRVGLGFSPVFFFGEISAEI